MPVRAAQIRHCLQLPSKVCERCCEFVRMWNSFRQMCLNSQVYLESTYLPEQKPDELMDASESTYMEYLYETLQLHRPGNSRYAGNEEDQQSELEGDYVVDIGDEDFVAVSASTGEDEEEAELQQQSKQKLSDMMITELESYEEVDDVGDAIEVDQSLMYADDSQTTEDTPAVKLEHVDDVDGFSMDNEDFLSPTPSPDPKPSTTAKRKPGRPRKPDSELKAKRKTKSDQTPKADGHTQDSALKYMCNLCGNVYPKKAAFTAHMMAHTDYKPHQCEICLKSFRQMGELRAHIRRHTGERPYKCLYCERHFYDRSEKVRHERVHTNTRPYECKECGKTFTHTAILKNHSLVHSGEKNFNCSICSKSFTLLHQLKAHLQTLTHRSKEEQAFNSPSSYILRQDHLE
ncbi:hypothetical protein KR222_007144 [Zaprionus bogoriensis]|nr:hypothetical protein KR222_007144 [Zaprionus bogoriensis]